jgi:hypothetical protein
MNLEDLLIENDTTDNVGGTKAQIFVVETKDIDTEGVPMSSPTTLAEKVTISDTHVLATGKKFTAIDVELDTGELQAKIAGDRGGKSVKPEVDFQLSRFNPQSLGFMKTVNNGRFIVLVPLPDGSVVQVGSKDFPAEINAEGSTGKNASGVRATKFKVESMANAIFFYQGTIDLTV